MPMLILKESVIFSGVVDVESAEVLHHKLLETQPIHIECQGLEHMHAAVVQVLLAHGVPLPSAIYPPTKPSTTLSEK